MSRITTQQNREMLEHNGYLFTFDRLNAAGSVKFWRCDRRYMEDCKARVHTLVTTGEVVKEVNIHSHGSDPARVNANAIRTAVKRRAEQTAETPEVIINETYLNVSKTNMYQMPNEQAIKQLIRRRRLSLEVKPPEPLSRATLTVPEAYATYRTGEQFLLYDSGVGDEERILIFGRQGNAAWSTEMKAVFADGTLQIAPPHFAQVYVLLAERNGFIVPVLYVLLPNKWQATYRRMFQAVKETWPQFAPESISMDFDKAAMDAATDAFPGVEVTSCFFHLMASMKKQLANNALMTRYRQDDDFSLTARMIVCLAFVPAEHVTEVFEELVRQVPEEVQPVLQWFERSCVGQMDHCGHRRKPLFSPNVWQAYDKTLQGSNKVNKFAEASIRKLSAEFNLGYPTFWKFIEGLRTVQAAQDQHFERFIKGQEPPRKRLRYQQAYQRIRHFVEQFTTDSDILYLCALAHNVNAD